MIVDILANDLKRKLVQDGVQKEYVEQFGGVQVEYNEDRTQFVWVAWLRVQGNIYTSSTTSPAEGLLTEAKEQADKYGVELKARI